MHQQRFHALHVVDGRIGQQLRPGGRAEALAQEEVAVAVHHVHRHAVARKAAQQARHHGVERLLEVVVADPVLEEIAQDVERVGRARLFFDKADEPLVGGRALFGEVKIRDEERRHYNYFLAATTVIDSMTTGCLGTSLRNGPPEPVGVFAILVTTSMPDTTLPNTA